MAFESPIIFLNRLSPEFGDSVKKHAICSFQRLTGLMETFPGNYRLFEALTKLIFQQKELNLKDVKTCIAALAPEFSLTRFSPELYEELQIVHLNYHTLYHVKPYVTQQDIFSESQRLAIKIATTKIFSSIIGVPIGKKTYELELESVFKVLTKASIEVFISHKLGHTLTPPSVLFSDHQLPRLRHLAAKENAKKINRTVSEEESQAAVKIQTWWKNNKSTVKVNHRSGNHSDEAHHVVALDDTIRKSVDQASINQFVLLMQTDRWHEAEMFKGNNYPKYAVAAFLAGKITRIQFTTVLRYRTAQKARGELEVFSILTPDLDFTDAAKQFLIPYICESQPDLLSIGFLDRPFNEEQLEEFLSLLKELSPSERIFYMPKDKSQRGLALYLSTGAHSLRKKVAYGESNSEADPRFGKLNINNIEHGVRANVRSSALATDESYQTPSVHKDTPDSSQFAMETHDDGHSHILSSISNPVKDALLMIVDCIRKATGHRWSKEVWDIIDLDFDASQFPNMNNLTLREKLRSPLSHIESFFSHLPKSSMSFKLFKESTPTCIDFIILLDLMNHPVKWQQLGVKFLDLTGEIKNLFFYATDYHYRRTATLPIEVAILKLKVFYYLNRAEEYEKAKELNKKIDALYKAGKFADLKFIKYRKNNRNNHLGLEYNGICIDDEKMIEKIIAQLEEHYNALPINPQLPEEESLTFYTPMVIDSKKDVRAQIEKRFNEGGVFLYATKSVMLDSLRHPESIIELKITKPSQRFISHCPRYFSIWGNPGEIDSVNIKDVVALHTVNYLKDTENGRYLVGPVGKVKVFGEENTPTYAGIRKGFFK